MYALPEPAESAPASPSAADDASRQPMTSRLAQSPSPPLPPFSRHDLVWLTDAGWRAARARASAQDEAALLQWQQHCWPAIVRRRDADLPPALSAKSGSSGDSGDADVCLGIPLPTDPANGAKRRIALRVKRRDVARTARPLAMFSCLSAAGQWKVELGVLADRAANMQLRVYGSLAMQTLTGLPCFTQSSDIDVLFAPTSATQLDAGLALLANFSTRLPLDGEIVFPGGGAVSWKEWLSAARSRSRVLVKEMDIVRLAEPAELLTRLEQP